ncbi:MAG: formimidoylglutamate deiminase [Steroidobacteraceae bacterium]|jgi:formimidoylglutamate deiminase
MARLYQLESALLPQGWVRGARISVGEDGSIARIDLPAAPAADDRGAADAGAEQIRGFVVPGMSNAHSHAFQRGMAGNTEYRLSAHDSFWTWRQAMYALANRITPEDLRVLAAQLFVEMLKSGYTAVAEFHYIHRRPDGGRYQGSNAVWEAVTAAAEDAGIALTFLPTLYQTSDFGAAPLKQEQLRFALETDEFLRAVEARCREDADSGSQVRRTGVAFHSLRAVPLPVITQAASALRDFAVDLPVHIHVAEQVKEVEACLAHTGRRPIQLLLETGMLDRHWCLVHATHSTAAELRGIAATGAVVCVSITTEANLGDGFFDAARFLTLGGRLCVGSDSQATVCPAEELRWMEYQARLRKRRRGVLADRRETHVGTRLWRDTARDGARAIGQPAGAIEVGARADWVVLDGDHPSMLGSGEEGALDHLIFAGGSAAIRDVMVGGRWVIRDRHHALEAALREKFRALM